MTQDAFFKLTYGIYIIAASAESKSSAYLGNTAFQVTAEPPQIAISSHKENDTTALIQESGYFSLSVLKETASLSTIGLLGYRHGKEVDKLASLNHYYTKNNTPVVLEDSLAWFECRVKQTVDTGSHLLFIGEVIDNGTIGEDARAMDYRFYREELKAYASENAPTYVNLNRLNDSIEVKAEQPVAKEKSEEAFDPRKFRCMMCEYVYDPAKGDPHGKIPPGTSFEDLPEDWICPICGVGKDMFDEY